LSGEASAAVALPRASKMEEKATMMIGLMKLLGESPSTRIRRPYIRPHRVPACQNCHTSGS
jgi:hypothetical protein